VITSEAITIRNCRDPRDFAACVALQKEVWQFDDLDVVPVRMFVVADKIGGQVIGAFEGTQLVGFTLAIPGSRGGHPYLHSHMLAVHPSHRNAGLGRKLKLAQRDRALAAGYKLMEWTFDPLEIKNAYLNLTRLGAIARRYNINQYGDSSSPLQGGLPTDRLVAEWWLESKRVTDLLTTGNYKLPAKLEGVEVPAPIYEWKAQEETRSRAREVQTRNREQIKSLIASGMSALGYERDALGNGTFLFGHWDEEFLYED
jgi:predicted GNAT superfamily acetyltransferase